MYKSVCLIFALLCVAAALPYNDTINLSNFEISNKDLTKANLEIPLSMMTRSLNDYSLIQTQMNFYDARTYCIQRHMTLISLKTLEDQINFMGFLSNAGAMGNAYWTLGNRVAEPWVWDLSGSAITYTNWRKGEPNNQGGNQRCLCTFANIQDWDDEVCELKKYFVCERR